RPPKTAIISSRTGAAVLSAAQRAGHATRAPTGAAFGSTRTMIVIASRLTATATTAGKIAARKRSRMKALDTMQYRIITIDGGMRELSVPRAAIVPVEKAGE